MKDFTANDSAWADFLISKAALILASIVLFTALFQLVSGFEDFKTQKQLDLLAWEFKNEVNKVGAMNFQEEISKESSGESHGESYNESDYEFKEISYRFNEREVFRTLPINTDLQIHVSGEYVSLEAESDGRNFTAVRPFTYRVLPFNESVLQEKLLIRFGADGSVASPLKDNYMEVEAFIRILGTEKAVMDPEKNISLKKELVYLKEDGEVSAFACILIYQ